MTDVPLIPRRYWAIAFGIVVVMAAIELAMGRHPICTCGTVKLFVATVQGPDNSQHLADWYTPSHIIHGFLFYLLGWLVLRRMEPGHRLLLAVSIMRKREPSGTILMFVDISPCLIWNPA